MRREDEIPKVPEYASSHDKDLFNLHFSKRYDIECQMYGKLSVDIYKDAAPTLYIEASELNTDKIAEFVVKINADACFIFGVDLILDPVLSLLPPWKINLHLGLSPWYKGSATLFWPFYFLQPQFAGATIHQIVPEADAGAIIHQVVPVLKSGQGIHDVAAAIVIDALKDIILLFNKLNQKGHLQLTKQKSSGRLFLSRDFQPIHLRIIYDLFNDKIVDEYLNKNLDQRFPFLITSK